MTDTRSTYKTTAESDALIKRIRQAYPLHITTVADAINYALRFTAQNDQDISEMAEIKEDGKTELLVLYPDHIDEVWDVLAEFEQGGLFDDNGGEPDGPSWYIEADEVGDAALLSSIEGAGLGYTARGVRVEGYNGSDQHRAWMDAHFQYWCGFSSRKLAYGIR
jgi:hypothetical protein